MFETSMLSVLVVLLVLASLWDVSLHRIPNAIVVAVGAGGFLASATSGGVMALGSSALACFIVAAAVWPAWTRHWIGGGDLKLGAATAAWLGIARVPAYLLVAAVAAGALSVACYALSDRTARAEVRRNLAYTAKGIVVAPPITAETGRVQVPAGAGFAVAAIVVLAMTGGL
jgi:prepilin peptidase CpaA